MPVEVALALRDTVVDAIAATGQIEAVQSTDLRPEVEGRVVDILIREGQGVDSGTPLFKLDDAELKAQVARAEADRDLARQALERTRRLMADYAAFQVPERYAAKLQRGQLVSFQVAALPGRNFSGEVVFVDPVVELPARTILIKAVVPNPRRELASGMFIEARLATSIRPNAVVVPEDAILPLQGATFVWVVKDAKADRRQG